LQQFVTLCLKVRLGDGGEGTDGKDRQKLPPQISTKHLVKLLAHPPADTAIVEHRRAILAELLSSPPLRKELEKLYATMARFRALIEGSADLGKWDMNRRRLDILMAVKDTIDCMADGFLSSRSGLSRLAAFGKRV